MNLYGISRKRRHYNLLEIMVFFYSMKLELGRVELCSAIKIIRVVR